MLTEPLPGNPENVKAIMKILIEAAFEDDDLAQRLQSPDTAKNEVEKYLTTRPENWETANVCFQKLDVAMDEIVNHFQGFFNNETKNFDVAALKISTCCRFACHEDGGDIVA